MRRQPGLGCAVALVFTSGALGLRRSGPAASADDVLSPPGSFRQQLHNNADMQYIAEMLIGGQPVRGLPDTGSYDFVVFGKRCEQCSGHGTYNGNASASFAEGRRSREQSYGSGSCLTQDGRDSVGVGPFAAQSLAFWQATRCDLPLLKTGGFDAVIGLGPPGHTKHVAQNMLTEIRHLERKYHFGRTPLPEKVVRAKQMFLEDVLDSPSKPTLLEELGLTIFSVCFGRKAGSPGWIVWNDTRPADSLPAPVFSSIDWSSRLKDAALVTLGRDPVPLGCTPGPCHAVLDTGTSILGVPGSIYQAVLEELSRDDAPDCSDLRKFPDLVLNVGDHELRFPPEAYVGVVEGTKSHLLSRFLHSDNVGAPAAAAPSGSAQCQLLLLDNGNNTAEDGSEEFVLGAPFFREYYTTFDVGRPMLGQERKIYIAPAGDQCQPAERAHHGFVYRTQRGPVLPRRVDASQLRLPSRWLRRLL
mmetsp:Transcript_76541/g.237004  ORF Transcript_76541/g.237004 Transcript_76541/m.237004 type:complete len:472 (-) Transcript_76541:66-1481(-)